MKPATYRAIKAILETDTSITGAQKQAVQRGCEGKEPAPTRRAHVPPIALDKAKAAWTKEQEQIVALIQ